MYYNRQGVERTPSSLNPPVYVADRPCWRCGGAGGAEKWRHTGWTCHRCGGNGIDPTRTREKLYTVEQNAKLDAAQAKRDARKRLAREQAAREEQARREAERSEMISANEGFIARIDAELAHGRVDFLVDLREQIVERVKEPTDGQIEAVNRIIDRNEQERARRAAANHVGTIKERRVFDLTLIYTQTRLVQEYPHIYSHWSLFTDENGCKIASKSSPQSLGLKKETPEGGTWNDRTYLKGAKTRVKATVVEHTTDKNGEPVTYINRPRAA